MLMLDPRVGSGDLDPVLRSYGVPVTITTLDFADCAFIGNGPEGRPVPVGIELKKLNDILSCITTGRFSGHQLPGLVQTYDEVWLIIEGIYRANPHDGVLEVFAGMSWRAVALGSRRWQYRDLESFLTTVEVRGGIRLRRTADRLETARVVAALYGWWMKEYDDHHAHLMMNRAHRDTALLTPPSLKHEVASCLPGLGYMKAGCVAGAFSTVRDIINASEKQLMSVPGVGKVLATRIVKAVSTP